MLTSKRPSSFLYFKGSRHSLVDARNKRRDSAHNSFNPNENRVHFQASADRVNVREQDPNHGRSSSAGARLISSNDESTLSSQSPQRRNSFSTPPNSSSIKSKENPNSSGRQSPPSNAKKDFQTPSLGGKSLGIGSYSPHEIAPSADLDLSIEEQGASNSGKTEFSSSQKIKLPPPDNKGHKQVKAVPGPARASSSNSGNGTPPLQSRETLSLAKKPSLSKRVTSFINIKKLREENPTHHDGPTFTLSYDHNSKSFTVKNPREEHPEFHNEIHALNQRILNDPELQAQLNAIASVENFTIKSFVLNEHLSAEYAKLIQEYGKPHLLYMASIADQHGKAGFKDQELFLKFAQLMGQAEIGVKDAPETLGKFLKGQLSYDNRKKITNSQDQETHLAMDGKMGARYVAERTTTLTSKWPETKRILLGLVIGGLILDTVVKNRLTATISPQLPTNISSLLLGSDKQIKEFLSSAQKVLAALAHSLPMPVLQIFALTALEARLKREENEALSHGESVLKAVKDKPLVKVASIGGTFLITFADKLRHFMWEPGDDKVQIFFKGLIKVVLTGPAMITIFASPWVEHAGPHITKPLVKQRAKAYEEELQITESDHTKFDHLSPAARENALTKDVKETTRKSANTREIYASYWEALKYSTPLNILEGALGYAPSGHIVVKTLSALCSWAEASLYVPVELWTGDRVALINNKNPKKIDKYAAKGQFLMDTVPNFLAKVPKSLIRMIHGKKSDNIEDPIQSFHAQFSSENNV